MNLPILVNKTNPLDKSYVPKDLIFVDSMTQHLDSTHQIYVEKEANTWFLKMSMDSPLKMYIDSGYRSFDYQQRLLDDYYQKDGENCLTYVALPGTSEHQTGLAIDFGFLDPETNLPSTLEVDKHDAAFKWLLTHAHLYGFILRYPKGKESTTGYQYEPWHLRFVGLEIAKEIYESEETLEEYVERKLKDVNRI